MKMKYLSIALLLLTACNATKKSTTEQSATAPTAKTAEATAAQQAPVTAAVVKDVLSQKEMEDGKKLYVTHCTSCHAMKNPSEFTAAQWNSILPSMSRKAKIDDATQTSIRKYLLASCK
jgi:trimethylamine-N-oxide reductase (cytochrome c)